MSRIQRRSADRWPTGDRREDAVAVEEPLEIRVDGSPFATLMRTPGDDLELAAGFLLAEGIVEIASDLQAIAHIGDPSGPSHVVDAILAGGVDAHRRAMAHAARERTTSSACGLCGKRTIEEVLRRAPPLTRRAPPDPARLVDLPRTMREHQPGFDLSGGLHAAALFSLEGVPERVREDVGRHNAVDKVFGGRLLEDRLPREDEILVVSSRAGFEIVQKALAARIGVVVAVGAPTTLAVDLAQASGIALFAFVREGRCTRYA